MDVSDKSPPVLEKPHSKKDSPGLIWIRAFDERHKYHYSEVEIESIELRALLNIELAHDPRFHSPSESIENSVTLTSRFEPLIHNWARLEELANADMDSKAWKSFEDRLTELRPYTTEAEPSQHISAILLLGDEDKRKKAFTDLAALLQQVRTTPELAAYFQTTEAQRQSNSIQFDYLWTIFPPGELVYSTLFMKMDQIFLVKECGSEILHESDSGKERDSKRVWSLVCWSYDWNGKTFNRVPITFKFEEFQGSRVINTLHCYPLKYYNSGNEEFGVKQLKENLIRRGKKFRDLCTKKSGSQMFDYDADAISHGAGFQLLKEKTSEVRLIVSKELEHLQLTAGGLKRIVKLQC